MTVAQKKPAPTAAEIREALHVRYAAPEWHVETELTLEGRRLDVVAFNRWGARGYRTVGFEIKVSQGDYQRELADFRKSEVWTHVVDQFFIVAPGKLVDPETLPVGWGLLEYRGTRLFLKRDAAIGSSRTLPRELVARMLDRMHLAVHEERGRFGRERSALREELRQELRARMREDLTELDRQARDKADEYDRLVAEFGFPKPVFVHSGLRQALRIVHDKSIAFWLERAGERAGEHASRFAKDSADYQELAALIRGLRETT